MKSFSGKKEDKKFILLIFAFAASLSLLQGQNQQKHSIKGQLKEKQSMQAMAYATVALRRLSDSALVTGTASNPDGGFILPAVPDG